MDLVYENLVKAVWVERKNRFVLDARLADGTVVQAHSNNTGTMRSCNQPGSTVWLEKHDDPKRKLKYSLRLVQAGDVLVGVDTSAPQKVFISAVNRGAIAALKGYSVSATEVTVAKGSRLDVLLEKEAGGQPVKGWVELKNVTLQEGGVLYFPDAITERGTKHLLELHKLGKQQGCEAFAVFMVQRSDGTHLSPAKHIDPNFTRVLRRVCRQAVTPLALRVEVSPEGLRFVEEIEVVL